MKMFWKLCPDLFQGDSDLDNDWDDATESYEPEAAEAK